MWGKYFVLFLLTLNLYFPLLSLSLEVSYHDKSCSLETTWPNVEITVSALNFRGSLVPLLPMYLSDLKAYHTAAGLVPISWLDILLFSNPCILMPQWLGDILMLMGNVLLFMKYRAITRRWWPTPLVLCPVASVIWERPAEMHLSLSTCPERSQI